MCLKRRDLVKGMISLNHHQEGDLRCVMPQLAPITWCVLIAGFGLVFVVLMVVIWWYKKHVYGFLDSRYRVKIKGS